MEYYSNEKEAKLAVEKQGGVLVWTCTALNLSYYEVEGSILVVAADGSVEPFTDLDTAKDEMSWRTRQAA